MRRRLPQRDYIERKGFSVTANLASRRAVFDAVGPFAGIEIAEDIDWGQRATRHGPSAPVYAPEVMVYHPARRDRWPISCQVGPQHQPPLRGLRAQGAAGKAKWVVKARALAASPPANIPRIATSDRLSGAARALAGAFLGLGAPAPLPRAQDARGDAATARAPAPSWNRE